ncbi:MAG: permease-like cell division protein FtsX [bacterium]
MRMSSPLRVVRFGFQNFFRNFWLSAAMVSVLALTVISINALLLLNVLGQVAVSAVESKIDVSVHFRSDVDESRVQTVRVALLGLQEVKEVEYVSPDETLRAFRESNGEGSDLVRSLDEVGGNPFGATLVIRAHDVSGYQAVMKTLGQPLFASLIEEQDFADYEAMVSRLNAVTGRLELFMLAITCAFGAIALLIVMNAVRVSVYTHREEIAVMRLVGASNWFIRGPFYVEALIATLVSVGLTVLLFYPILVLSQPFLQRFFDSSSVDLVSFYSLNLLPLLGLQFAGVAAMTLVTTKLATARYLKV